MHYLDMAWIIKLYRTRVGVKAFVEKVGMSLLCDHCPILGCFADFLKDGEKRKAEILSIGHRKGKTAYL